MASSDKPGVGASVLLYWKGKILASESLKEGPFKGSYVIPGGKVEMMETLVDGVCRETYEETKLVLYPEHIQLLGIHEHIVKPNHHFLVAVFRYDLEDSYIDIIKIPNPEPEKHREWKFYTVDEFLSMDTWSIFKKYVLMRELEKSGKSNYFSSEGIKNIEIE